MFKYIIYAIIFWQVVNKTTDCFNNIVFILAAKISSKEVCEKMENHLLEWNRNAELLRLEGATFDSKVAFLRRMRKKYLIILKSLPFFCFFCLSLLTFELSKCSENCNMLTEWTYNSASCI